MITYPRPLLTLGAASLLGLGLGLVDTSPNWDDTGISAGTLVLLCLIFGALKSAPPWASALAVAAWIPILNIATSGNAASLMVVPIAIVAAYLGRGARLAIGRLDPMPKPR